MWIHLESTHPEVYEGTRRAQLLAAGRAEEISSSEGEGEGVAASSSSAQPVRQPIQRRLNGPDYALAQGGEGRESTDSGGLPAFNPAFALNSHVAVEIADEASLDRETADEWLRLKSAVFAEASKEQWKGKPPGVDLDGLRWWQEQRFRTHAAWGLFCRTFPLQAGEGASERIFSGLSFVFNPLRSSLSDESLARQAFVRDNMSFLPPVGLVKRKYDMSGGGVAEREKRRKEDREKMKEEAREIDKKRKRERVEKEEAEGMSSAGVGAGQGGRVKAKQRINFFAPPAPAPADLIHFRTGADYPFVGMTGRALVDSFFSYQGGQYIRLVWKELESLGIDKETGQPPVHKKNTAKAKAKAKAKPKAQAKASPPPARIRPEEFLNKKDDILKSRSSSRTSSGRKSMRSLLSPLLLLLLLLLPLLLLLRPLWSFRGEGGVSEEES